MVFNTSGFHQTILLDLPCGDLKIGVEIANNKLSCLTQHLTLADSVDSDVYGHVVALMASLSIGLLPS